MYCIFVKSIIQLTIDRRNMHSKNEIIAIQKGYFVDNNGNAHSNRSDRIIGTRGSKEYAYIGIKNDSGKNIKVYVHRLQAFQKFGENIYKEGVHVRHLNGNSFDNSFDNIEIGTASENMLDKPKINRIISASNASKKYSDELALEIKNLRLSGCSYKDLMKKYGISSKGTINAILNRKTLAEWSSGSLLG